MLILLIINNEWNNIRIIRSVRKSQYIAGSTSPLTHNILYPDEEDPGPDSVRTKWQLTSWRWKLSQVCLASGGRVLGNNLHTSLLLLTTPNIPHDLMAEMEDRRAVAVSHPSIRPVGPELYQPTLTRTLLPIFLPSREIYLHSHLEIFYNVVPTEQCRMTGGNCGNIKISKHHNWASWLARQPSFRLSVILCVLCVLPGNYN